MDNNSMGDDAIYIYIYICVCIYICIGGVRVELDKLLLIGRNDTTRPDAYSFLVSKGIRIHHPFVVLPCRSVFWGQTSERGREGTNRWIHTTHQDVPKPLRSERGGSFAFRVCGPRP
jgi:hypothetical protein